MYFLNLLLNLIALFPSTVFCVWSGNLVTNNKAAMLGKYERKGGMGLRIQSSSTKISKLCAGGEQGRCREGWKEADFGTSAGWRPSALSLGCVEM